MKIFRNAIAHMIFIILLTGLYAYLLFFPSVINFHRLRSSSIYKEYIIFRIKSFGLAGDYRYTALFMILLTGVILASLIIKKIYKYDEYQSKFIINNLATMAILTAISIPYIVYSILSNRAYAIDTLIFISTLQWCFFLTKTLIDVLRF